MTWRTSNVIEEARRNLVANAVRYLGIVMVVATTMLAVCAAELNSVDDVLALQREQETHGKYVFVARLGDGEKLSASACIGLNTTPGVAAAAPVEVIGLSRFSIAPDDPFVLQRTTSQLWSIIGAGTSNTSRVLASSELANRLGLGIALDYPTPDGSLAIDGVFDPRIRAPSMAAAVSVDAFFAEADECWVAFKPTQPESAIAVLSSSLSTPGHPLTVSRSLTEDQFSRDPLKEYLGRPSRYYPALGSLIIAAAVIVAGLAQRSSAAVYRLLGARRRDVFQITTVELALSTMTGFVVGGAGLCFLPYQFVASRAAAFRSGATLAGLSTPLVIAGGTCAIVGRLVVRLRD